MIVYSSGRTNRPVTSYNVSAFVSKWLLCESKTTIFTTLSATFSSHQLFRGNLMNRWFPLLHILNMFQGVYCTVNIRRKENLSAKPLMEFKGQLSWKDHVVQLAASYPRNTQMTIRIFAWFMNPYVEGDFVRFRNSRADLLF